MPRENNGNSICYEEAEEVGDASKRPGNHLSLYLQQDASMCRKSIALV